MTHVRLFLMRHSKSCANHVRHVAGTEDRDHPLVSASQELRDPALSEVGQRMAREYGPALHRKLAAAGFDLGTAMIGASALRRARETAGLLFPGREVIVVPHFTEHGRIPENTPRGGLKGKPSWAAFVRYLKTLPTQEAIIVGHGSFLRTEVWERLTGRKQPRVENLDGLLIEGDLKGDRLVHRHLQMIRYDGSVSPTQGDRCSAAADHRDVTPKIRAHTRKMANRKTRRRQRKTRRVRWPDQSGGGVTLPLAYFQNGAQFMGTSATPTGVGLAGSSGSWVREPLAQQKGGGRQAGGFTPSIMGPLASNGMKYVVPLATYMGYKTLTRKTRRRR